MTASQLPASPKSSIISAVAMVELATTAILVPTRVVDSSHSGRFSSMSSARRAPREPLAAAWRSFIRSALTTPSSDPEKNPSAIRQTTISRAVVQISDI